MSLFNEPPGPGMILRNYQESAKRELYTYLREKTGNPCIVIPTGGGKSPLMASICADAVQLWNGRVLIAAHVKELLVQTADKLQRMCPTVKVGIYSAGLKRRDTTQDVIIGGVQSIFDKADQLGRFDLLLIDEAHLIPESGYGRYRTLIDGLIEINPDLRIVGLTATPFRTDTGMICTPDGILNHVCYEVSVKELIALGYLTKLVSKAARHEVDTSGIKIVRGEYDDQEAEAAFILEDVVEKAVDEILLRTTNRKSVLIFCQSIAHAEAVAGRICWAGHRCREVYGDTKSEDRKQYLGEFQRQEIQYLVNVNVLTTGFDAPAIDCVCLMRATVSPGLFYQMVGRGFRLAENKADCLILDFGTNIERHGPVDAIQPKIKGEEQENKGKKCPQCSEVVSRVAMVCPDCGYVWPPPEGRELTHGGKASDESPISGEVEIAERCVQKVTYKVHTKKNAPPGWPQTLRVTYELSNPMEWISEWVCVEHQGFARTKAEAWWASRCQGECPTSAEDAFDFGATKCLAEPYSITTKIKAGDKFPEITKYRFREPGEDDLGDMDDGQAVEMLDQIPF